MKKSIITMAALAVTMLASANPFFHYKEWKTPHGTYPFNDIRPEHYMPAFEEGIKQGLADIDAIVNNPAAPTFKNTIEAYEKSGELLTMVAGCFYNLTSAETNDELQAIAMELSPKMSEYSATIRLNEGLFARIKAVYDQKDNLKLNPAQQKLLEDIYESFANNGANLNAEQKLVYKELSAKLSQLTLVFGQNVLKATNAWTMLITNEADLAGLKDDTKAMLKANAEKKGLNGWLLDLKPTTYIPVMEDCQNRDIRRELYTAYNTRAIGGEFDNTQIIIDIVNTRLALAQLFDKACHADKSLTKTCAESKENVYNFLDQLRESYMPVAEQEVAELQEFAKAKGFYATLQPWDWSFYSKQLKEEKYAISDDLIRPYFQKEKVIEGVFGFAKRMYGITFKENKNIQVYHPEVIPYEVFDQKGKYLAVFYLDFHPRDGKRGGAWMNNFQEQYGKHRPHVVNVMNFTRPVNVEANGENFTGQSKPALFSYDEVETFLHEFGHALHGLLANTKYSSLSGTNVYRDFVELPSQFNENYLTQKEFLDGFARHYQTGEAIPQELVNKIITSSQFGAAYACLRQLNFGLLDMAWHTIKAPVATEDAVNFEIEAGKTVEMFTPIEGSMTSTTFSHIFGGGYAAGYYSYKWAEVLDADAFAKFLENGIFDRKTANEFKENVLMKGGTENPAELYRRFRGQEPSIDALLKRDGIEVSAK